LAQQRDGRPTDGKSLVTCVDKSNVLRSYAFFRRIFDEVADGYPDVRRDYAYVDAMAAYLVLCPYNYDVIVTENMFGDILSDLSGATVGGLGMAPSGDIGDRYGLFQPAHGTAPSIAGKNMANPVAMVLSASMMLDWLGTKNSDYRALEAAHRIEEATSRLLAEGECVTADLGGSSRTSEVGDSIAELMKR
jgi:3-isopropylmalate dehydrogenase